MEKLQFSFAAFQIPVPPKNETKGNAGLYENRINEMKRNTDT